MGGLESFQFVFWKVKLNIIFDFAVFEILNLFEIFSAEN
jgi:hypothetical protein